MNSFSLTGWIPTVSGRLSLSLIGKTDWPYPALYYNQLNQTHRYIAVYQRRWSGDAVHHTKFYRWLNSKIFSKKFKTETQFTHAFFLAMSDIKDEISNSQIQGTIYFVKSYAILLDCKKIFRKFEESEEIANIYNRLKNRLDENTIVKFDVTLNRSGKAVFTVDPENYEEGTSSASRLMHSAYYFLKDISHTHQHHSLTKDTIIGLYDNRDWEFLTLKGLMKSVLDYKRELHYYSRAKGILAYARAFCRAVIDPSSLNHNKNLKQIYDATNSSDALESINASQ